MQRLTSTGACVGLDGHSHDRAPMTTDRFFEALRSQASVAALSGLIAASPRRCPFQVGRRARSTTQSSPGRSSGSSVALRTSNRDDAERATRVAFDSPEAQWKVFRVAVKSEWALESNGAIPDFDLVTSAETRAAAVESGLVGTDVLVLEEPGWFQFDAELPNIGRNGELLGRVGNTGALSFPVMESEDSDAYLGNVKTLQEMSRHVAQRQ